MKQLTVTDWIAVGLAAGGVLVSLMATIPENGRVLFDFGGLLTWAAVGVAIYGFVTRNLGK